LQAQELVQKYPRRVGRIREIVHRVLPTGLTVIVVSKGDTEILNPARQRVWHFPQDENGDYTGHHPADSAEAIAHLESLRAKGGEFLLFPNTAFWWLEHYGDFRQHLDTRYRRVWGDEHCIIFQLSQPKPAPAELACPKPS
jgi:hypothetical protein